MSSGGILESLKYLFEGWDHCIGQNFHHFMANRSDKYLASKPIYQPFDLAELRSFDPICVRNSVALLLFLTQTKPKQYKKQRSISH
nr:hypothetical protein CFP56_56090 [Quercus suber]